MPIKKRIKTKYPGVYFITGESVSGKPEKIYYVRYRKNGKMVEEKAGRQFQDDMTPARAAQVRVRRIEGIELSNWERRKAEEAKKAAELGRWTIDKLFNEYIKGRPANKSRSIDKGRYMNYLKPHFGNKEPKEILPLDVDRIRIQLLKKLSPQTVKHVLNLLTWIINFGLKKNLCDGISFHIQKPRVNNIMTEDLSEEQLKNLLDAIEKDSNIQIKNLMKLALYTGMRRGELFKLKWDDINFERGFIDIIDPKGGPDQKIPMNELARNVLSSHPKTESPYVFPGRGGEQRVSAQAGVNRIKKRAGLPKDFRPLHGLRHAYASMLASTGEVDMYTLQKLLTHKDPRMTQRYAHLRDETLKKASSLAGSLIEQASKDGDKKRTKKKRNKIGA
jgi:integrase